MSRLRDHYNTTVRNMLREEFQYENPMQVPRLSKVVLNMGVGEASQDRKKVETAAADMTLIAGQKPVITRAKKSIAGFKLREGMAIGCKVTLRRERMYEFLDRLINIALPRVRDFRGLSKKSFEGRANSRPRRHHLHDGEDGRRSAGVVESVRHAVRELGAGGRRWRRRAWWKETRSGCGWRNVMPFGARR